MRECALQDAKARLSEVVRLAMAHEPQEITLRGEPAVVVVSRRGLRPLDPTLRVLVDFMRRFLLFGADDVDFPRDQSLTREVELQVT